MPERGKNLADSLRELMRAAVAFEKKAARHARIEAERQALLDAITRAQLELSVNVQATEVTDARAAALPPREPSAPPALRGIPGGQRVGKPTRSTRAKTPARSRQSNTPARHGRMEEP